MPGSYAAIRHTPFPHSACPDKRGGPDLAKLYGDDPDPGVHGAAEWSLRQLGAHAEIVRIRAAYATGTVVGDRRWYLTKTGPASSSSDPQIVDPELSTSNSNFPPLVSGLTFLILQPEEFLMGSPVTEAERYRGPTGKEEARHRRRIGRQFAISAHEVTVAQFQAFRSDHPFDRTKARRCIRTI